MTKNSTNEQQELRVLKSGTCPSLSGRSKLTYEIAVGPSNELHVRIAKNSGTGFFSEDWVAMERLQRLLDKNANKPITCHTLSPLFEGQSVNTAGFVLAALKHAGLVEPSEEYARCYQRAGGKAFIAEIQALLSGTTGAKAAKAVKPARPAAVTKAATPAAASSNTLPKRATPKKA